MGNTNEPFIYEIGEAVDHRGSLEYYNDLTISNYKRFYIVKNPTRGTVRAWHGHKKEAKLVKVLKGEIALYLIKVENWDNPSKDIEPYLYKLNENSGIVYVPPGFANGAINLVNNTNIMYFSSSTLEESKNDDFRFDPKYWNVWKQYSPEIYE